jgi:hypothetical protein
MSFVSSCGNLLVRSNTNSRSTNLSVSMQMCEGGKEGERVNVLTAKGEVGASSIWRKRRRRTIEVRFFLDYL